MRDDISCQELNKMLMYRVDTGGLRNEVELTQCQINSAIEYAVKWILNRSKADCT